MAEIQNIHIQKINGNPLLNICLFRNTDYIDIAFHDSLYQVYDLEGNRILNSLNLNRIWRIKLKNSVSAIYEYYLVFDESTEKKDFEDKLKQLDVNKDQIHIFETGGNIVLDDKIIHNNKTFLLTAGPFHNAEEARHNCHLFGLLNHCNIYRRLIKNGSAEVEIFDSQNEFFSEVKDGVQIVPYHYNSWFSLLNIDLPQCGIQDRTHRENLSYQGGLTIGIDENSFLSGVNEIPVELYLNGVMSSELANEDNPDFIKSMAVTARSQIFNGFGKKHTDEKYDFCCSGHCLRYYGIKAKSGIIAQAIQETEGMVLVNQSGISSGNFCFSCGGHTEDERVAESGYSETLSYGKLDGGGIEPVNLTDETEVRTWILSQPDVNCRPVEDSYRIAPSVSADSFRWEVFSMRHEIEECIQRKTGEDPGIIYEIIPLKRGVSGRIQELEILGSLKNVKITGELNIRSALSDNLLNSSCFVINTVMDDEGVPLSFTFIGAGTGHGAGLCKTGAAKMAADGKVYTEILNHYFDTCSIKKIY